MTGLSQCQIIDAPAQPVDTSGYRRVKPQDAAQFYRLHREGLTGRQIAAVTGFDASTVSRHLSLWTTDTADEADKLLKAKALDGALAIVDCLESRQDKVKLDAGKAILTANKLLGNEDNKVVVGVQVVLGVPGNHKDGYQTQTESVSLMAQHVTGTGGGDSGAKVGGESGT